jgi:hypothetical protein
MMAISEKKMQIVIDNYFKLECDVNTSIRKAYEKGFRTGVQKGLAARPKLGQEMWIPCSERLPTKKTEVIYSLENRYVCTGYMTDRDYNGDEMELHWEDMESGALIYPEAWMPLPEPYKDGEQDG